MVLTSSLEDPSFNIKGIKVVNTIVQVRTFSPVNLP